MKIIHKALFIALALTALVFSTNCDEKIDDLYIYFSRAISKGDIGRMENAIKHGADVNHYFKDGETPLMHAITRNQTVAAKYLIKKGADVNKPEKKERYYRPLHKAIMKKNIDVIKYLVEHGANINGKSWHGQTAFHIATVYSNIEIVNYLYTHGGDITKTRFHFIRHKSIALYMIKKGAEINAYNESGSTAVHVAIINNNIKYLQFLIDHGADVNKKTIKGGFTGMQINKWYKAGITPLELAKLCNVNNIRKKVIIILKKHGAR